MKRNGKQICFCEIDNDGNILFEDMEGNKFFINDCDGAEPIENLEKWNSGGFSSDGILYWWKEDIEAYLGNELGFDEEAVESFVSDCYGHPETFMVEDYLEKHPEASASDFDENGWKKTK